VSSRSKIAQRMRGIALFFFFSRTRCDKLSVPSRGAKRFHNFWSELHL
jgi:hypothetical protein